MISQEPKIPVSDLLCCQCQILSQGWLDTAQIINFLLVSESLGRQCLNFFRGGSDACNFAVRRQ